MSAALSRWKAQLLRHRADGGQFGDALSGCFYLSRECRIRGPNRHYVPAGRRAVCRLSGAAVVYGGTTDEEIVSYLEDRFAGIRLDPQFSGVTALLWLLPIAAVAGGVVLARSRTVRSEA